jgi:Mitochondrial ribosomal protein L31
MLSTICRKIPWRLSAPQKARQRKRLKLVDKVVDTVSAALQKNGGVTAKAIERWYKEMPREEEMLPKDKYTIFDRKEKKYRKGIHKLPKWTRVSQRVNPPGF